MNVNNEVYIAVNPEGTILPFHQKIEKEEFQTGTRIFKVPGNVQMKELPKFYMRDFTHKKFKEIT